jgi:transcriptional regulator with XRE-family HTH domain
MKPAAINSIRDLAALARGRRRALGLSQAELAERAGVSRQWVSGFEAGNPGAELRLVIALLDSLGLRLLVGEPAGSDRDRPDAAGGAVDLDTLLDEHRGR